MSRMTDMSDDRCVFLFQHLSVHYEFLLQRLAGNRDQKEEAFKLIGLDVSTQG